MWYLLHHALCLPLLVCGRCSLHHYWKKKWIAQILPWHFLQVTSFLVVSTYHRKPDTTAFIQSYTAGPCLSLGLLGSIWESPDPIVSDQWPKLRDASAFLPPSPPPSAWKSVRKCSPGEASEERAPWVHLCDMSLKHQFICKASGAPVEMDTPTQKSRVSPWHVDTADPQTSHLVDRQWRTLRQDSTSEKSENDNCSYLEPVYTHA